MKQFSIALIALFVFGCTSLDKLARTTHQINIDGAGNDWPELDLHDKTVGMQYGVTYDQKTFTYSPKSMNKMPSGKYCLQASPYG